MSGMMLADFQPVVDNAWVWFLAPIGAVLALLAAFVFSRSVMGRSEGEENMIHIAEAVRKGAMAYLVRQYRVVFVVFIVLVAILAILGVLNIQPLWTAVGVPIAGLFSGLCGWFGMKMATNASARTTWAAKQSLNDGLTVAFRSGAVMGLVVVGFALLDVSVWYFLWNQLIPNSGLEEITAIMLTYGMGASTRRSSPESVVVSTRRLQTSVPTLSVRSRPVFRRMILETPPPSRTTLVTTSATWPAWAPTSTSPTTVRSSASMALGATAALSGAFGEMTEKMAYILASAPMALAGLGIICSLLGVFVVRAKEGPRSASSSRDSTWVSGSPRHSWPWDQACCSGCS